MATAAGTDRGHAGRVKLTVRQEAALYIAVVAEVTGRLMQGKPHREEREVTAHEAHHRGLVAIRHSRNGVARRAAR